MPRLNRFSGALRPCTAFLLYVCAWATFPPAYADQQAPADPQGFAAVARRAIARGRPAEAEALAKQRPATDGAGAGVLGQLAAARGRYDEADRSPRAGRGARAGQRGGAATRAASSCSSDAPSRPRGTSPTCCSRAPPAGTSRGCSAAPAPHRRSAVPATPIRSSRRQTPRSADPAIDTAWGLLFLEKYNKPEALHSLAGGAEARTPSGRPRSPASRACSRTRIRPAAAAAARKALEIDPDLADAHLLLAELDLDNREARRRAPKIDRRPRGQPVASRSALAGSRRSPTSATTRPAFDARSRSACWRSTRPTARSIASPAQLAARNYRFEEAVALAREAVGARSRRTRARMAISACT